MADAANHGWIGERRARSLAGARGRGLGIKVLRYALLLGIAALIFNAGQQLVRHSLRGEAEPAFAPAGSNERIVNPRFTGRDQGGAPFTITADAAVRRTGGVAGVTDLERPALDYAFLETGEESQVLARAGEFDEAAQSLLLRDQVRFSTRSGYAFETDTAMVRLREGRVEGQAAVLGYAPWGAVRADAFDVREEGRYIILTGDVRTRIEMVDD